MSIRNGLALALVIFSFGLLYPGVTEPIFSLKMTGKLTTSIAQLETEILDSQRSILTTVQSLYDRGLTLVAALILFFSVVVPLIKNFVMLGVLLIQKPVWKTRALQFLNGIGKWSMADVFVVAILLAWMSTENHANRMQETITLMGMKVPIEVSTLTTSQLGDGFYYFLAYCMVSLATLHVVDLRKIEQL